jgi:hypothetical protein
VKAAAPKRNFEEALAAVLEALEIIERLERVVVDLRRIAKCEAL